MTSETHNTNPVKPKPRRWFRFRLWTLLVMVTLMSVPLGWVGWELDQRRREKAVVSWVEEMGRAVSQHGSGFVKWTQRIRVVGFGPTNWYRVITA